MIFLPIIIFGLGLIVGSFLNVVILRINTGKSIVRGRSICTRCSKKLHWYELVPVFSFLGLRGRCSSCKESISFQYPLVELLTGIVFVLLYTVKVLNNNFSDLGVISFVFSCFIASLLIIIFAYDFRHKIIPTRIVYLFILFSFLSIFFRSFLSEDFPFLQYLLSGFLLAAPFFLISVISKGKAMGFADFKLALGIGFLSSISQSISVFVLSFWIGAVCGCILIAFNRSYGMKSQVPFAPFMIIAFALVSIFGFGLDKLFLL